MDVFLFVMAAALLGVLIWLQALSKVQVILALLIGAQIGGWAARWLAAGVGYIAGWVGRFGAYLTGMSAGAIAAAVPAAIGLVLFVILVRHMWPKKGKATTVTVGAAFALPMLWPALMAGLEHVSPGITGGA